MKVSRLRTVSVDFDGVLHQYDSPWVSPHVIPDPPVEGALLWLWRLVQAFEVVIFSTRCQTWRGRRAIRRWLQQQEPDLWQTTSAARGLEEVTVSYYKLPAIVYIDDRAFRFRGSFPRIEELRQMRPWNKGGARCT